MATNKPLVSAIVVSYNVRDLLLDSLRAFYASSDVPVEVGVVDNSSRDGAADAVAATFRQAKVIRLAVNVGFGKANNAGFQQAEGRFILLLNPDVTGQPGCVGRLTDFMLVRPDAGAVGPRLERPDGTLDLAARRGFPTPSAAFYRLRGLHRLLPTRPPVHRHHQGHPP